MNKSKILTHALLGLSVVAICSGNSTWAKDLDPTDNKAPVLISISIDKYAMVEGEVGKVTVKFRDDKNELMAPPVVLFGSPSDSPGSISGGVFARDEKLVKTEILSDYVEQTFQYSYTAPSWPGQYFGFNIQGVRDKNGNESGFNLQTCVNKNIYITPQMLSFPNIIPTCDTKFTVRLLSADEKVQIAKAAADKAAKDPVVDLDSLSDTANAATDAALAAADAADAATAAAQDASDSARADGRDLMTINTQIQNLDTGYKNAAATLATISMELDKRRAQITQFQTTMNAATNSALKQRLALAISKLANAVLVLNSSKTKLEFQVKVIESRKNSLLIARDQFITNSANPKTSVSAKPVPKEKTIVCIKGKSPLKVIGKNPKCPAGYKVKK